MNTPEQEAEQLINNFYVWGIKKEGQSLSRFECRQLALIAVNLMIYSNVLEPQLKRHRVQGLPPERTHIEYWQKTKEIIQSK